MHCEINPKQDLRTNHSPLRSGLRHKTLALLSAAKAIQFACISKNWLAQQSDHKATETPHFDVFEKVIQFICASLTAALCAFV